MMKFFLIILTFSNFIFCTQNIVVAELFTETWWPYCPDARAGLQQLNESAQFFIPLFWEGDGSHPSPNYGSRASLYGVGGIPHVEFGGYIESVGGGGDMYPTYLQKYNQLINNNSPLSISQTVNIAGGNIIMQATVTVTDATIEEVDASAVDVRGLKITADAVTEKVDIIWTYQILMN